MRLFSFFLIYLIFIATACSNYNSSQEGMDNAEKLLTESPDSALKILERICPDNRKDAARHGLLLTIAQDRNYITSANDSIAKIAIEYYPVGSEERMKADYYAGRINFLNGNYKQSVESLLDAEESALILNDNRHLGLIYRELTYIFNSLSDQSSEHHYAKRAYECFEATGDSTCIKFSMLDYGRALSRDPKSIEAGRIMLDSLIAKTYSNDALDMTLRAEALRINIGAQLLSIFFREKSRNDFLYLMRHFTDTFPDDFFKNDTPNGNAEDYYDIMPLTSGVILNIISEPYAREIHSRLNSLYLDCFHREKQILSSEFRMPDYQNFSDNEYSTTIVDEYLAHRQERLIEKEKSAHDRWIFTLWALAILATISIATYIIRTNLNRRKQNGLIADASELRHMLKSKDRNIKGLQEYMDSLYGENFKLLEELCDMFILPSKQPSEQKRIYESVKSIVEGFKMDGKRISDIEKYVNRYKGDVATKFRTDFPGLPERDYALFLYLAAGFSRQAISYFMGDNASVVYNRKTRLKKRILSFDGINKTLYLEALDGPSSCSAGSMIENSRPSQDNPLSTSQLV